RYNAKHSQSPTFIARMTGSLSSLMSFSRSDSQRHHDTVSSVGLAAIFAPSFHQLRASMSSISFIRAAFLSRFMMRPAVIRPYLHQLAALLEQVSAPIRLFDAIRDRVRERHLDDVVRIRRCLRRPISER